MLPIHELDEGPIHHKSGLRVAQPEHYKQTIYG